MVQRYRDVDIGHSSLTENWYGDCVCSICCCFILLDTQTLNIGVHAHSANVHVYFESFSRHSLSRLDGSFIYRRCHLSPPHHTAVQLVLLPRLMGLLVMPDVTVIRSFRRGHFNVDSTVYHPCLLTTPNLLLPTCRINYYFIHFTIKVCHFVVLFHCKKISSGVLQAACHKELTLLL